MLDPREFLSVISAHTQSKQTGAANRPPKFAVIDPAYSTGLPQVTFDGETDLTEKGYPYAASYMPVGSDRVLMLPVGTGYLILCSVVA